MGFWHTMVEVFPRFMPVLLEGAVIGMIDNAKIGTSKLFDHIAEILKKQHGAREFIRVRKPDATKPVPPAMLASLAGADAILAATGD